MAALLLIPMQFDLAMLIGRVFIGVCFVVHAFGKMGLVGPGNMQGFEGWLKSMGVPFPGLQARLAMLSELIGGALIVLGLGMRPACIVVGITMLVAATLGHKGGGYLVINTPPGLEYPLNLAAICLVFFLLGPGVYSLDAVLVGP